ncbi:GumC family protein [Phreatobacter cathodiphilus]|uniref:Lipopolysaccharide biosynthesis protein n=1 Tax=Phreatobacter cathodiphilus TaxID=1868589 RepID=A0A2S0N980_9HYPH|nr:exopolysaccharide transport family protein [Phreatobacter cathodiphilus]AVO44724.1 lipopolysaccharide biosynthesis protein [Phreatobacter cathodiphilus]
MGGAGDTVPAGRGRASLIDLDLAGLARAVWAARLWIAVPTLVALGGSFAAVTLKTPTYRSEARILVENGESAFTRPESDRSGGERAAIDQETVLSQVQLILSRDVAKAVAQKLDLARKPEFDPALRSFNPVRQVLIFLGLAENPMRMTAEERVLRSYFEKLTAFQVDKSRIISIQFDSHDPALAAEAANMVAAQFIEAQQANKRSQTRNASQWLSGEVDGLRRKVEEAEGRVESFRARANLFVGSNNTSLTAQQLAEVNSQIAAARAQQSDAQTRARLLRDFLRTGRPIESGEILNSEIIRRLNEQRAAVLAQLAEQSSTLGPRHPRIAELQAQRVNLDGQIRTEAEKLVRVLENDARFAGARVEALQQNLDQVKRQAGEASEQEVQLRVLEREAKSLRDQLETLLARYRDASARDTLAALPADARVISRALVSNVPAFPKKLPTILVVTLGTMLLAITVVVTLALLAGAPVNAAEGSDTGPAAPDRLQAVEAPPLAAAGEPFMDEVGQPPVPATPDSIAALAHMLEAGPDDAGCRRTLVIATRDGLAASGVALALGRELAAGGRRVVLVDLDEENAFLSLMVGQGAAGLSDFAAGAAGFGDIIHTDAQSACHVVPAGNLGAPGADMTAFAVEALSRSYEAVVLSAGVIPAEAETFDAMGAMAGDAVVVAEGEATDPEVRAAHDRLVGAGLKPVVVMLATADEMVAA